MGDGSVDKRFKVPLKESYLLIIIIVGILSLCMYSSFALFSLEKTTSKDIFTMKAASDIETTLKIFEYKKITVSAGDNTSVMVNVNNDTGGSIYYGVFYEMVSPSTKTDDIGIYKIDWSANATSGSITNGSKLPVELIIINNSSSDITLNIGVAGSDSNELGLPDGKTLITETFNTGTEPSGDEGTTKTTTTDYSYTGAVQTATLKAGTHKLEVWGAQGGGSSSHPGGKGGYSYGTLTLTKNITSYIYVGGQGTNDDGSFSSKATLAGGFNGGGYGRAWNGTSHNGGGGGGASDIRLVEDSLYSRVIVAGGGGGGSDNGNGGYGGGTSGGSGNMSGGSSSSGYGFGTGGDVTYSGGECGGGGSGWYGGTGGSSENYAGGGGSGYVYTSGTASSYPSGVKLNSSYYLTNASTIGGNTSFTDNSGSTVTGHSGNGYARITSTVKTSTIPSIDTSNISVEVTSVINLKDVVTCNDNGSGCKIVLVKPSSSAKMKYDMPTDVMYILEDNNGNRYRYTKSVEIYNSRMATRIVKNLNDNSTGDSGSGVYKVEHSAIESANSATGKKIPAVTDYRYYGASPSNYICLDMDGGSTCPDKHLYRIIGSIYEETSKQNLVKVVKATAFTDGNTTRFSWDSYRYKNIWAYPTTGRFSNTITDGSSVMRLLNNDFLNTSNSYALSNVAQNYISKSIFYLGGWNGDGYYAIPKDMYVYERGTTRYDDSSALTWQGMVALMYGSDLGYAAGNTCATEYKLGSYVGKCDKNDWMSSTSSSEWSLSAADDDRTVYIHSGPGPCSDNICVIFYEATIRPSFYLTSSTLITGGTGTESDPYIISK